jgi:dolichol-phosphate mannosyltransferase
MESAVERPQDSGKRTLVSLVIPCFNEQESLPGTVAALRDLADMLAEREQCDAEFILVDDGSTDGTWVHITRFAAADPRVVGLRFSRNFGQQAAFTCGYRQARGDVAVSLDADLQDPPQAILEMVRAWRGGADVVLGVRRTRSGEGWFKLATARLFYWLIARFGAIHVRPNVGDFRLVSRRALNALLELTDRRPFFREMVGWIGFPTAEVHYDRMPRAAGTTKYTLRKMVRLAADAIVDSSTRPLLFPWIAAALILLLAAILLSTAWPFPGASAVAALVVIPLSVALILVGQGVQNLYLSRLYESGRGRPLYVIAEVTGVRSEAVEVPQG